MPDQDLTQTSRYIELLTGDANSSVDWRIWPEGAKAAAQPAAFSGPLSQHKARLLAANAAGCGVFITVNQLDGKGRAKANVNKIRALFVDKDPPDRYKDALPWDIPEEHKELPPLAATPTMRIKTGRGEHAYWVLDTELPVEQFTPTQVKLFTALGTDASIKDEGRVMRVPGFYYCKGLIEEQYLLVELVEENDCYYAADEVLEVFDANSTSKYADIRGITITGSPAWAMSEAHRIATLLLSMPEGTGRNNALNKNVWAVWPRVPEESRASFKELIQKAALECLLTPTEVESTFDSASNPTNPPDLDHSKGKPQFKSNNTVDIADTIARHIGTEHLATHGGLVYKYSHSKGYWRRVKDINSLVQSYHRSELIKGNDIKPLLLDDGKIQAAGRCLMRMEDIERADRWFEQGPGCGGANFLNTWVGIDESYTLVEREPNPGLRTRWAMPYKYDPQAECPKWLAFLDQVWADQTPEERKNRANCLGIWLGSTLLGKACDWRKMLLLYGPRGANGKSTMLDVIETLFPDGSVVSVAPQDFDNERELAALAPPVLLNIVGELPKKVMHATSKLKAVIAGDKVAGSAKYKGRIEFRPVAGHISACNVLPPVTEHTKAMFDRFIIIGFTMEFEDKGDKSKIVAEMVKERSGIARWAMELAADAFKTQTKPYLESSDAYSQAWSEDTDSVKMFLNTTCVSGGTTGAADLYAKYAVWAKMGGFKNPCNIATFKSRLQQLGVSYGRTKHNRYWGLTYVGDGAEGQGVLWGAGGAR